jgi:hypothetical protein
MRCISRPMACSRTQLRMSLAIGFTHGARSRRRARHASRISSIAPGRFSHGGWGPDQVSPAAENGEIMLCSRGDAFEQP